MSDNSDDDDPLSELPDGYTVLTLDDGWPPAKRFEDPSMVAIPPVPRPRSVTQISDAVPEELAGNNHIHCVLFHF